MPPLQAGYVAHEEEVGIAVLGRPYTVDLMAMRQVKDYHYCYQLS